jgi:hypothetical protein
MVPEAELPRALNDAEQALKSMKKGRPPKRTPLNSG